MSLLDLAKTHPKLTKGAAVYHLVMAIILIAVWIALY